MGSSLKGKGHPEKTTTAGPVDDLHSCHPTPGFSAACDNTRPVPSWLRSLVTHHLKAAPRLPLPHSRPRLSCDAFRFSDSPTSVITALAPPVQAAHPPTLHGAPPPRSARGQGLPHPQLPTQRSHEAPPEETSWSLGRLPPVAQSRESGVARLLPVNSCCPTQGLPRFPLGVLHDHGCRRAATRWQRNKRTASAL